MWGPWTVWSANFQSCLWKIEGRHLLVEFGTEKTSASRTSLLQYYVTQGHCTESLHLCDSCWFKCAVPLKHSKQQINYFTRVLLREGCLSFTPAWKIISYIPPGSVQLQDPQACGKIMADLTSRHCSFLLFCIYLALILTVFQVLLCPYTYTIH